MSEFDDQCEKVPGCWRGYDHEGRREWEDTNGEVKP